MSTTYSKNLWHRLARSLALVVSLRVERVAQPKRMVLARHVLAPVVGYRRELSPAKRRIGLTSLDERQQRAERREVSFVALAR